MDKLSSDTQLQEHALFWAAQAKTTLQWEQPWDRVISGSFNEANIRWFEGAKLNASVNCLDRHLADKAHKKALIWAGDEPGQSRQLSFAELHHEVCLMGNVLRKLGIKKGMCVGIYLPLIPEAIIAMLACARIGAIHTVIFAGFSAHALRQRLENANCQLLISADGSTRAGKHYALKTQADEACLGLEIKQLLIQTQNTSLTLRPHLDYLWRTEREQVSADCPAELMDAEDPLFILYTSGSTGTAKGLVHTTAGYLLQVAYTHRYVFDCKEDEIFWSTADVGWITGHSYVVYGPLANGICTFIHSGVPTWPNPGRYWELIDQYQINVLYTAPTAIRTLMRAGDSWLQHSKRSSLRLLGSVGEPINPEAWQWYFKQVGQSRCPIIDSWWQTETGAIMLCPNSKNLHNKPGAAAHALPGISPVILDEQHHEREGACEGALAIKYPWPAIARTIVGNPERYKNAYFHKGYYITGDGAKRDEDGDYWLTGRIDDVLNVSGHRIGNAEVESALVSHQAVAEAAVIGLADEIKGEAIHAFVSLKSGQIASDALKKALIEQVVQQIGAIAKPESINWVEELPKTRSGKIMRRILRKIASGEAQNSEDLGDISTLANPDVLDLLFQKTASHND